jgi:hypothetical protein
MPLDPQSSQSKFFAARGSALLLAALLGAACTGSVDDGAAGAANGGSSSLGSGGSPATGGSATNGAGGPSGLGGTQVGSSGGQTTNGGSPGTTGGSTGTPTTPGAFGACPAGDPEPGVTPLMKLSTLQYRNTVRDLLVASGLTAVADTLPTLLAAVPDDSTVAFRGLDPRISADHLAAYFNVARAVGDAATSSNARLTALAGACATTTPLSSACLDSFLQGFGRRAFRRPLSAQELTEFRDVAQGTSPKAANAAEALRNVVVTLLLSPRFVNHLELSGTPVSGRDDYLQLDPYETASRLSYTFWQTLPDEALLAAAADGSLATDAGFETQLERVFSDARTQQTLWQFWNEWLRFESFTGFAAERPGFQALAKGEQIGVAGHNHWADMVQEIRDLTELYTWKQKGTFSELMTSTASVTRSADLARLYGVSAWSGSGAYPSFPDGTRTGLLQRAALLASSLEQTNPFHRGSLLRRAILCDPLPRPDANSLPPGSLDAPPPSTGLTTRQRFAKKVEGNALCETCHASFSNLGYVMEAYDALGRFRTMERVFDEQTGQLVATLPVDTSAIPQIVAGDMRPVGGPAELNQRILESGKVEACLSANYFRYALRRDPSRDSADACVFEALRTELSKPGVGLRDVFRRLASEPGFRRKKVGAQ